MPGTPIKLLLVEDNPDQREITIRAFRKMDVAVAVTGVENGPAALELLLRDHFDAIILDYSLPQMNGLEVLSRIQERGYTTPVIMVTGQGDEKIAVEAMKFGAYDYLIKGKNYQETLPIMVQKVIEKNQLKARLQKASVRAHRLYEISLTVTKERKVEVLIQTLVDGARQLIQTEGAMLLLIEPENSIIIHAGVSGIQIDLNALKGRVSHAGLFFLAAQERQPVVIEAPDQHPLWPSTPAPQPPVRQILSVPVRQGDQVTGVLTVMNKQDLTSFSEEDKEALSTLAVHAGVAIDNARFLQNVEKQAVTDSLTGLYNHGEFQRRLMEEVERGTRYAHSFSLLILDIDHFKVLNDTHGHVSGDMVLKEMVRIMKKSIRFSDIPSRYGGEEFAIILPETPRERAKVIAERIRQSIEQTTFSTISGYPAHLTVSIGIASFPEDMKTREELIIAADQALYFAKNAGRNRICSYTETLKSAIENHEGKLNELLVNPNMTTLRDLATAIDAKSPYTRGHTEGVAQYATLLAEALDLNKDQKKSLQVASFLHSIGTVSIPDTLFNKTTPLTPEEIKIIQAHPTLAEMLLKKSAQLDFVLPAILYHHERYDGHGYPNGLKGEAIPFLARILGAAEAYQAMISDRSYRPKLTPLQAMDELKRNSGSQFDPRVVEAFLTVLNPQQ